MWRYSKKLLILLPVSIVISLVLTNCSSNKDWRTASRESAGLAPDPVRTNEAVLQVYGADAWGWRGWFAIHTWIAAKRAGETTYTVYDVVGWRGHRGHDVMRVSHDIPDRYWFGAKPEVLVEHRGPEAEELIKAVEKAAERYPWKSTYKVFPGPNSNTFTAWIGKQVPELGLDLPFSAIGSGYVN